MIGLRFKYFVLLPTELTFEVDGLVGAEIDRLDGFPLDGSEEGGALLVQGPY